MLCAGGDRRSEGARGGHRKGVGHDPPQHGHHAQRHHIGRRCRRIPLDRHRAAGGHQQLQPGQPWFCSIHYFLRDLSNVCRVMHVPSCIGGCLQECMCCSLCRSCGASDRSGTLLHGVVHIMYVAISIAALHRFAGTEGPEC